jgi:GNAT superfamily N-acetyltransferase
MAARGQRYTVTKELPPRTWPDFDRLFSYGNGWDFCSCIAFQRAGKRYDRKRFPARAQQMVESRHEKRELVDKGRAHGIIVYAAGEPVGWCQFGPRDELPLPEYRRKFSPPPPPSGEKRWRITCFVTLKEHRREGISGIALRAALQAIRKKGGGIVEAFPVVTVAPDPDLKELIRVHGGESEKVRRYVLRQTGGKSVTNYDGGPVIVEGVLVDGVGPVSAVFFRHSGMFFPGTVPTFEREGFKAVAVAGRTQVLMQRTLRSAPRRSRSSWISRATPSAVSLTRGAGTERMSRGICVHRAAPAHVA